MIAAALLHFPQKAENTYIQPVAQQVECVAKVAPQINVKPSKSYVRYDFTKTKAQLNAVDIDTVSPYGPNHQTIVSGLMSGSIQVKHQVAFLNETYKELDQGCIYLKSIDVNVHIDPTIYIAREHPKGTCMHNAVLTHELKHVREDQLIVNKYAKRIGQALVKLVDAQGPSFGPYETARVPFVQQNIQNSITRIMKQFNDQMNEERQRRQQAIDSIEEYESIGKKCKNR